MRQLGPKSVLTQSLTKLSHALIVASGAHDLPDVVVRLRFLSELLPQRADGALRVRKLGLKRADDL